MLKFRAQITMLLLIVLTLCATQDTHPKGRPWDFKQVGNTDADGGKKTIAIVLEGHPTEPDRWVLITVHFNANISPVDKADSVCKRINELTHLTGTHYGDVCEVQVDDDSPWAEIKTAKVQERVRDKPGDKGSCVKDDPLEGVPILIGVCDFMGAGVTLGAEATLQIGESNPIASVSTLGKSATQIEYELIANFNWLYTELGYTAEYDTLDSLIYVSAVPCSVGICAGSDDEGIGWEMGLIDELPSGRIPTLTEWGLIIFGVVLLGFITYVFLRRRKAVVSLR